jgi:hypothetical protein
MNHQTTSPIPAPAPPREIKIGLWGGHLSGKTTYLAALKMAALLHPAGDWRITGPQHEFPWSNAFLLSQTALLRRGEFPKGTVVPDEHKFEISGRLSPRLLAGLPGFLRSVARVERTVNFSLYVRDYPGQYFANVTDIKDPLWGYLAACDGLIYLHDAGSHEDALDYVNLACNYISNLTPPERRLNNKLPHFLAICVSKFDSPAVLEPLRKEGLVERDLLDARQAPYVTQPKKAFELLADEMVANTVRAAFAPQRTQYFFNSSIGFYAPPGQPVNLDDCHNVIAAPGGPKIRSGRHTYPVNILTPLLWIENEVSALARRQAPLKS